MFSSRLAHEASAGADPGWREVDFTFQAFADGVRRLTSVKDFAGREWVYSYNALGQLTSVRSPIVVGTSTGDDFPAGRTERYTYSSGFADPVLNFSAHQKGPGPAHEEWTTPQYA